MDKKFYFFANFIILFESVDSIAKSINLDFFTASNVHSIHGFELIFIIFLLISPLEFFLATIKPNIFFHNIN